MKLVIGMLIIGVCFGVLSRQPAKIQDRVETGDVRGFCGFYYEWRSTQIGGVSAVDRLCFDAQEMRP